jgi:HlyD family secretion protein
VLALFVFLFSRRSAPPEVPFTRTARETIVSNLNTNGKTEPYQWSAVRADREGAVEAVLAERGATVRKGQLIARMDVGAARAELSGAQARVAGAVAEQQVVKQGGRSSDLSAIESGLASARADLAVAQRELSAVERLQKQGAATTAEVTAARDNVQKIQLQIQSFEQRRKSLVGQSDQASAEARIREAQSQVESARLRIVQGEIRSPQDGVLYQLEARPNAYLNPGDLIAMVGKLDRMRVTVYVDEPELGRVRTGMPVTITWDALPGREWKGEVERTPTQIVTLGTRQVGEVTVVVDNPDLTLIPGTNVNAEIRSSVVQSALSVPKEAIRRQGNQTGVYKLAGDKIQWTPVKLGISSVTRTQVLEGLQEGDQVALPVDRPLKDGDEVKPVSRG